MYEPVLHDNQLDSHVLTQRLRSRWRTISLHAGTARWVLVTMSSTCWRPMAFIGVWAGAAMGLRLLALAAPIWLVHHMERTGVDAFFDQHGVASAIGLLALVALAGIGTVYCQSRMVALVITTAQTWAQQIISQVHRSLPRMPLDQLPDSILDRGDERALRLASAADKFFTPARVLLFSLLPTGIVLTGSAVILWTSPLLAMIALGIGVIAFALSAVALRATLRLKRHDGSPVRSLQAHARTMLAGRFAGGAAPAATSADLIATNVGLITRFPAQLVRQRILSQALTDFGTYVGGAILLLVVSYGLHIKADWASLPVLLTVLVSLHQVMGGLRTILANLVMAATFSQDLADARHIIAAATNSVQPYTDDTPPQQLLLPDGRPVPPGTCIWVPLVNPHTAFPDLVARQLLRRIDGRPLRLGLNGRPETADVQVIHMPPQSHAPNQPNLILVPNPWETPPPGTTMVAIFSGFRLQGLHSVEDYLDKRSSLLPGGRGGSDPTEFADDDPV